MDNYRLADLDELILKCRDDRARERIAEAVACYKAGALRSCIVATWVAVVFDILSKLAELDLTGDKKAKKQLEAFDAIRRGGDAKINDAMQFEQNILRMASEDFELLTPTEMKDLETLRNDRHRCAHPTMLSIDELYQPTPELARSHIRNAVEILLQREPVQGKAAFERICGEIKSEYFPEKREDARKYFASGPLKRARKTLIRSLIIGLTKSYLNDDHPDKERHRQYAALGAVYDLHTFEAEDTVKTELARIVSGVADANLWRVLAYVKMMPSAWDALEIGMQDKLKNYLKKIPSEYLPKPLANAMCLPQLESTVLFRINDLSTQDLARIVQYDAQPVLFEPAISAFAKAGSFRSAEDLGTSLLLPIAKGLSADQIREVLHAIQSNNQIWNAAGMPDIVSTLFDTTNQLLTETADDWQDLLNHLVARLPKDSTDYLKLQRKMKDAGIWD